MKIYIIYWQTPTDGGIKYAEGYYTDKARAEVRCAELDKTDYWCKHFVAELTPA